MAEQPEPASVRRLTPLDAALYRALMLEAYALHPTAFTSDADERSAVPLAWWEARLSPAVDAGEFAFGAWHDGALVGAAGLSLDPRAKARHKATLFGVYVREANRRQGRSRALVDVALRHAGTLPQLRLVQLTVTEDNAEARALYAGFGFVEFGFEPMAIAVESRFFAKVHLWRAARKEAGGSAVRS